MISHQAVADASHLDLTPAPYVSYGLNILDLVSLCCSQASDSHMMLYQAVADAASERDHRRQQHDSTARATAVVAVVISAQPKTFGASRWSLGLGKPNALVGKVGALLAAWRPGEEGGTALVDIISGRTNPSGRLTHTWPAKAGQAHSVVSNSYHMPATSAGEYLGCSRDPHVLHGLNI